MKIILFALVITAASALSPSGAYAQQRRYTPSQPTVSPYLNLLRQDSGPILNYYNLVRPQLQQRAFQQQQQAINLRQQSLLGTQQQGLRRVQEGLLEVRQPEAAPTGAVGGFMNYGHFYSFPGSPGLRR